MQEIETKVLDIDKTKVTEKLLELGAKKESHTRLVVDWYRTTSTVEGEEPWFLRVRSDSEGKHEVTWKAKSDIIGTTRKHKEINFLTNHPEEITDLFQEIGLEKYAHQEKDRDTFRLQDWQFDIDTYPGIPPFVEIEGSNEEHVKEAVALLNLEKHKTWADGERTLIMEVYNTDWYMMTFN